MINHRLGSVFCVVFLVGGCAVGPDMSLMESLNTERQQATELTPAVPEEQAESEDEPVQTAGSILNEADRAATLARLKALSAARQSPQTRAMTTSAAELKRLGSSHADEALGEIESESPQN